MGFCFSWLAVRGKSTEQIENDLNLTKVGPIDGEFIFEQPYASANLRRGWYGVFMNDFAHDLLGDDSLRELSKAADVIACMAYDTVMDSQAQYWRNGQRVWAVRHNGQLSIDHIELVGESNQVRVAKLKEWVTSKRSRDNAQLVGDAADYTYEIPKLLAFRETGFKEDRISRRPFVFYEMVSAGRRPRAVQSMRRTKPFWKFWQ